MTPTQEHIQWVFPKDFKKHKELPLEAVDTSHRERDEREHNPFGSILTYVPKHPS